MNKIKVWKFVNLDKKKEKEIIKKNSSEVSNGYGLSHVTYLNKAFKTLLNKKIEAPVSAYEAFLTSILVHSLYKSSELKKAVNLSLNLKSNKLGLNN
jgi:hypothetical protein